MTFRARFAAWGAAWAAAVAGVLALVALVFAPRLPEPIASHWDLAGTPDDSAELSWFVLVTLGLWAVLAGIGLMTGLAGAGRQAAGVALLVAGGVFVCGVLGSTVWANLDVPDWQQARALNWQVFAVLGVSGLAGAGGHRLAANGCAGRARFRGEPAARLRAGEQVLWTSAVTNRPMLAGALVSLPAGGALAALGESWVPGAVLVVCGLALLVLSSVRVHVSDRGLAVAFGPMGWPVRRIDVGEIAAARVERRRPVEVGGWGYRGLPGRATIMLRGGECLVVRRKSGGELGISVDDAERGAELLNARLR